MFEQVAQTPLTVTHAASPPHLEPHREFHKQEEIVGGGSNRHPLKGDSEWQQ